MTDKELVVFLQHQISDLTTTLASLTKEVAELRVALLEKDKDAQKLKRFVNTNLPKKIEKRKSTVSVPADKQNKERGNNGAKRKVYDNIEEVVKEVLPSDASFDEKSYLLISPRCNQI